jgi:predicted enzyme involved in methoxymalonyl-ACP biosynthesis
VIGDDGLEGIALGEFDEGEAFVGFHRAGMFSRADNKSHF